MTTTMNSNGFNGFQPTTPGTAVPDPRTAEPAGAPAAVAGTTGGTTIVAAVRTEAAVIREPPEPPEPERPDFDGYVTIKDVHPDAGSFLLDQPGGWAGISGVVEAGGVSGTSVTLTCDGHSYRAALVGNAFTGRVRLYHQGQLTVVATASAVLVARYKGKIVYGGGVSADPRSVPVTSVMTHQVPTLSIISPADGGVVPLGETGTTVPFAVQTADTNDYGPRQVTVTDVTLTQSTPATASLTPAGGSTTAFGGSLLMSSNPVGARTFSILCRCPEAGDLAVEQRMTLVASDVTGPHDIAVSSPSAGGRVLVSGSDLVVQVTGTVSDQQSGMGAGAQVQCGVTAAGPWTPAAPAAGPGDLSTWRAALPVPGLGANTLYVNATDAAGNQSTVLGPIPFEVLQTFSPADLDMRLNDRYYLTQLMDFASQHVHNITDPTAPADLTTDQIVAELAQPLDRLAALAGADVAVGATPVNQLRLPIELLGRALSAKGSHPDRAPYLAAAYSSLLGALGTAPAEIASAARSEPAARAQLAARLGIPLYSSTKTGARPDQLDTLLLDPGDPAHWTEQELERLFGLPASVPVDQDPLRPVPDAQVLLWQLEWQRTTWQHQDSGVVAVDPDIITTADILPGGAGATQALQLLDERSKVLQAQGDQFRELLASGTPEAAFTAMATAAGVPLPAIIAADEGGLDTGTALAAAGIDSYGYRALRQWQVQLDAQQIAADSLGWATVIDILVGAYRRHQYATWSAAETAFILSPDTFTLAADPVPLSRFRIDPADRAEWSAKLAARTAARQSLRDGAAGMVTATEQATLPVLRNLLLAGLVTPGAPTPEVELTERYGVDFLANGAWTTTRLGQATAGLQAMLKSCRSGGDPGGWSVIDPAAFDAGWKWMATASTWRAATTAFLFPEQMMDPSLLVSSASVASDQFAALYQVVHNGISDVDTDAAFQQALEAYQTAAAAGTSAFSYRVPGDRRANQIALHDLSNTLMSGGREGTIRAREIFWTVPMALGQVLETQGQYQAALDWYWIAFPYNDPYAPPAFALVQDERDAEPVAPDFGGSVWTTGAQDPFALVLGPARTAPHLRSALLAISRCLIGYADQQFTTETDDSLLFAGRLYAQARKLLVHNAFTPVQPTTPGEIPYPVPLQQSLLQRVANQLDKLHQNRNIAGLQRQRSTGGAASQIVAPTAYRYPVLRARAQQLVQQAGQIEQQYLAALEKYDSKTLQESDAANALHIAQAQTDAHLAQEVEAADGVTAARDQTKKATTLVATLQQALATPANQFEHALLGQYQQLHGLQDLMTGVDAAIGCGQAAASVGLPWQAVGAATEVVGIAVKTGVQLTMNDVQAQMSANQLQSSIEERSREYARQLSSASGDLVVAQDQQRTAADHQVTATRETAVARTQQSQAQNSLTLLQNAFTDADLYQWLAATVGGAYRYFLQQATATAKLAQAQLSFERARPVGSFIADDYWNIGQKGLAGAELLTQDIAQLDDYAFSTDQRRLNISQTFSLAQQLPLDFLGLQRTGRLAFSTPADWFAQDFPDHLLRLIKQVKVSVVALVPPARGIRGTLSSSGISRVTAPVGSSGTYAEVTLRRDPGVIALTNPVNADGLVGTDTQPELLLPFEGSGVDTSWNLELPPAANPFDYSTLSDVLLTVEYTALHDSGYGAGVRRSLNANRARTGDRILSFVQDFPDQWYDLHNPADPTAPRSISLALRDVDFPPNIGSLTTAAIVLHLDTDTDTGPDPIQVTLAHASLTAVAGSDPTGTVSTRRGAAGWASLVGYSPVGEWQFTFGPEAATLLDNGHLSDILFDITWSGQSAEWPT